MDVVWAPKVLQNTGFLHRRTQDFTIGAFGIRVQPFVTYQNLAREPGGAVNSQWAGWLVLRYVTNNMQFVKEHVTSVGVGFCLFGYTIKIYCELRFYSYFYDIHQS